ncbi:MAG: LolA family protein [Fimbriimonadaceae bacterium]
MPRPKPLGFLITALGVVACTAASGAGRTLAAGDKESALRLLVKAFDRVSPRNIVAVMRMSLDRPKDFQTVEVQIAKDGRQRVTVLHPIQQAGMIILELGEFRWIYNPDKRSLTIGRSASADLFDPSERLRLVRRNYTVRMTRDIALANLKTVVRIDATSHYPEVGGASVYIDPASYFVMRVDAVTGSGVRINRFDTSNVAYPASLPPDIFRLKGVEINSTTRESDPVAVRTLEEAKRLADFTPLAPHALPFGFVIRKKYVRLDSSYNTIGFNLSDGLAAATVFEFDLRQRPADVRSGILQNMQKGPDDYFRTGDTVVGIVSNLEPKARKRLLSSFRPRRRTSLNETENRLIDGLGRDLSRLLGTISGQRLVTPYRRMWRTRPQFG